MAYGKFFMLLFLLPSLVNCHHTLFKRVEAEPSVVSAAAPVSMSTVVQTTILCVVELAQKGRGKFKNVNNVSKV